MPKTALNSMGSEERHHWMEHGTGLLVDRSLGCAAPVGSHFRLGGEQSGEPELSRDALKRIGASERRARRCGRRNAPGRIEGHALNKKKPSPRATRV